MSCLIVYTHIYSQGCDYCISPSAVIDALQQSGLSSICDYLHDTRRKGSNYHNNRNRTVNIIPKGFSLDSDEAEAERSAESLSEEVFIHIIL